MPKRLSLGRSFLTNELYGFSVMASWWQPRRISSLSGLLRLMFLLPVMATAEESWRYLAHATSTLTTVDFRSGGSCSEASLCRREVLSARATILGHPLYSDNCGIAYRDARDGFNENASYSFTLGVLHSCEDGEGRVLSKGEGVCAYEVCAMYSWERNGTLDYQVVVTHEAGSGENETRTVSVDVYLSYDNGDGSNSTSLGDGSMCSSNRTCGAYSACGGDSAEVLVEAYDSHGDGWIDPFGNTTESAYWKLEGADRELIGTVFEDHVTTGSRFCLNKGDYNFTAPGNVAWPNDVSWNLCDNEGFAGEALVITVEDGRCTPVGDVVSVAPVFLNPPGTGDDVMCDTCAEYSSQLGSQIGVYYESACDPELYTNNSGDGFVNSGGGSGCAVRDYFDEADATCRFCIVNRELWREENPGARDPDWPDCPCCVADYLNVPCVTLDVVLADTDDVVISSSTRDQSIAIIALSCAVGVAIFVILGCCCCIIRDRKKRRESRDASDPKQAVSKESSTGSERSAFDSHNSGIINRGAGRLATSYSDSSISSNKRKRVEFDATQAVVIAGVKFDGKSKSCRDIRDVAPDPDTEFRFGTTPTVEEEVESSMAEEASNPMFDPMHRAKTQPVPVLQSSRHQQRYPNNQEHKKQPQREQRPYDEDYARVEEGMGKISGYGDAPVSPPRYHGPGPKHRVHVKVYRSGIPPRLHAARGGAMVVTRRTSNRPRYKDASPKDMSRSNGDEAVSIEAVDQTSSVGSLLSHHGPESVMQIETEKAYSSEMSISSLSDSEKIERKTSKLREEREIAFSPINGPSNTNAGDERGAVEVLPSSETGSIKSAVFETPTHSRGYRPSSTDGHSEHSGKGFSFPRPWRTPGDGGSSIGTPVLSTPTERGRLRGVGGRYRRALSSGSENSGNGGGGKKGSENSSGSGSGSGGSRQGQRKRRASLSESPFRESLRATGRGIIMRSTPLHSRMQVGPRRSSPSEEATVREREVGGMRPLPDPGSEEGEGKGADEEGSVGGGSKSRSKGSRTSSVRSGLDGGSRPRRRGQEGETSSKRGSHEEDAGDGARSGNSRVHSPSLPLGGRENEKGDGASVASAAVAEPETLVKEKESVVPRAPKRSKSIRSIGDDDAGTTPSTEVTSAATAAANNANGTGGSTVVAPPRPPLERSKRSRSIGEFDSSRTRHMRSLSPGAYSADGNGTSIVVPRVQASPGVARPSARLRDHVAGRVKRPESMKRGSTGRSQSSVAVLDLRRNSLNGTGEELKNDPGPPSTSQDAPAAFQENGKGRTGERLDSSSSVEEVKPNGKRDRVVTESVGDIDGDGKRAVSLATPPRSAVKKKEEGSSSPGSEIDGRKTDSMVWENALRKSIPLMLQRASSKVTDSSTPRVLEDKTPLGSRKRVLLDPSPSSVLNGHSPEMFPVTKDQREQPAVSVNGGDKEPKTAPGASSRSSRLPLREWFLPKQGSEQPHGRVARGRSLRDANNSTSSSGSSSEDESGEPGGETREVTDGTEPFDSEEEEGRTADAENVQYRYTARSRIRELSYQSARSRSRGSCQSLSSLTRVVEVSEESESSSQTSGSFDKAFDDADASEPVTMPRLEQPKRKQKEEGLATSRSVQGNAPAPAPRPSSDVREEPVRPSHIASLSRPLSRSRPVGREGGERAEHGSNGAQSASASVPGTAPDAAPAARRIVSPSRAPQKLPSRESTAGKSATEVAAGTKERSETLGSAARSVDSSSSSNVCNLLVGTPSLTEDASRAVEEALNVPPMFTPSTAAAAVAAAAAAAVAVSDSSDDSGDNVSRTSLASSVPTEVDTGLHGNVGSEPGRGRSLRGSRLGGGGSEGSTSGRIGLEYYNDADDTSSFDADTWSDFTGRSSGGSGRMTRSLTPLSAGGSMASSASAYQSARGSRGSTGTPGGAGWREQAKIRKAMVLAAQKAQEKALHAGNDLDVGKRGEGRVGGSWTAGRPLPGEESVASMTPDRDGRWRERGRSRSRAGMGSEEAGDDTSRGGTGEDERRRERSSAGSSTAWSSSGSTYSARSRTLGGPDVYERGPRGRTGPRGHVLAGRSNSRSHLPPADGPNSLTSSFESPSVNSSVTSSEMLSVASSSGGGRSGRPPRASSVSSSLDRKGRTKRRSRSGGSRSCEGDYHVRDRSTRQSRHGQRRGHDITGVSSSAGFDRNQAFLLDKDSRGPPQSRGEPSAETVNSAATLFRSRSQLTELRQQRDKEKGKHVNHHHGHRRRGSSSGGDRRNVPSTSSGSSTGRSSSWSVEAVYHRGMTDNQGPLQEGNVDGSDSGNDEGGTARTLANSADAKGYYGFLLPSEDRSLSSVEEAKRQT